jgi:hypothetical protein
LNGRRLSITRRKDNQWENIQKNDTNASHLVASRFNVEMPLNILNVEGLAIYNINVSKRRTKKKSL